MAYNITLRNGTKIDHDGGDQVILPYQAVLEDLWVKDAHPSKVYVEGVEATRRGDAGAVITKWRLRREFIQGSNNNIPLDTPLDRNVHFEIVCCGDGAGTVDPAVDVINIECRQAEVASADQVIFSNLTETVGAGADGTVTQTINFINFPSTTNITAISLSLGGGGNASIVAEVVGGASQTSNTVAVPVNLDVVKFDFATPLPITTGQFLRITINGATEIGKTDANTQPLLTLFNIGGPETEVEDPRIEVEGNTNTNVTTQYSVITYSDGTTRSFNRTTGAEEPVPAGATACDCDCTTKEAVQTYADSASFPANGETGVIYIDQSTNTASIWDGTTYQPLGGTSTDQFLDAQAPTAYADITAQTTATANGQITQNTNNDDVVIKDFDGDVINITKTPAFLSQMSLNTPFNLADAGNIITLDSSDLDIVGGSNNTTTGEITVNKAGFYRIDNFVLFDDSDGGSPTLTLEPNERINTQIQINTQNTTIDYIQPGKERFVSSGVLYANLNAGDVIRSRVFTNIEPTTTRTYSVIQNRLTVTKVA